MKFLILSLLFVGTCSAAPDGGLISEIVGKNGLLGKDGLVNGVLTIIPNVAGLRKTLGGLAVNLNWLSFTLIKSDVCGSDEPNAASSEQTARDLDAVAEYTNGLAYYFASNGDFVGNIGPISSNIEGLNGALVIATKHMPYLIAALAQRSVDYDQFQNTIANLQDAVGNLNTALEDLSLIPDLTTGLISSITTLQSGVQELSQSVYILSEVSILKPSACLRGEDVDAKNQLAVLAQELQETSQNISL